MLGLSAVSEAPVSSLMTQAEVIAAFRDFLMMLGTT